MGKEGRDAVGGREEMAGPRAPAHGSPPGGSPSFVVAGGKEEMGRAEGDGSSQEAERELV